MAGHERRDHDEVVGDVVDRDEFFRAVFEKSPVPTATISLEATFLHVNEAGRRLIGYSAEELVGAPFGVVTHADSLVEAMDAFLRLVSGDDETIDVELRVVRKDGTPIEVELSATAMRDSDGELWGFVTTAYDVTDRRAFERMARHRAAHDPLTELPNRAWFTERVTQALARAARQGTLVGVYFVDLDGFKAVNDAFGHQAGDQVLFALAGRLDRVIRPGDTLARYGGDEFTVLCEDLPGEGEAADIAGRICAAVDHPIRVGAGDVHLTASVGVAVASPGGADPANLVHLADVAMYEAKQAGKARYRLVRTP